MMTWKFYNENNQETTDVALLQDIFNHSAPLVPWFLVKALEKINGHLNDSELPVKLLRLVLQPIVSKTLEEVGSMH